MEFRCVQAVGEWHGHRQRHRSTLTFLCWQPEHDIRLQLTVFLHTCQLLLQVGHAWDLIRTYRGSCWNATAAAERCENDRISQFSFPSSSCFLVQLENKFYRDPIKLSFKSQRKKPWFPFDDIMRLNKVEVCSSVGEKRHKRQVPVGNNGRYMFFFFHERARNTLCFLTRSDIRT